MGCGVQRANAKGLHSRVETPSLRKQGERIAAKQDSLATHVIYMTGHPLPQPHTQSPNYYTPPPPPPPPPHTHTHAHTLTQTHTHVHTHARTQISIPSHPHTHPHPHPHPHTHTHLMLLHPPCLSRCSFLSSGCSCCCFLVACSSPAPSRVCTGPTLCSIMQCVCVCLLFMPA